MLFTSPFTSSLFVLDASTATAAAAAKLLHFFSTSSPPSYAKSFGNNNI
jgi:hypothetical protein